MFHILYSSAIQDFLLLAIQPSPAKLTIKEMCQKVLIKQLITLAGQRAGSNGIQSVSSFKHIPKAILPKTLFPLASSAYDLLVCILSSSKSLIPFLKKHVSQEEFHLQVVCFPFQIKFCGNWLLGPSVLA